MASRLVALTPRPKLLVLVVLEQIRPDHLEDAWSQFGPNGLRRIFDKGAYFPDCRHLASTFTATSIVTLATGAWPAQHGIVADSWYDRTARRAVSANEEALEATTLSEQVPDSGHHVFVVAMNRTHAALAAGTPEAHLYWMDDRGQFTTNGEGTDWLTPFNQQHQPDAQRGAKWMAPNPRPDTPPLRTLIYNQERPLEFMALYRSSPFAMQAVFELAMEVIAREGLGQGANTDLVIILPGSSALLGYEVGGLSPLMPQMALALDRRIEALLGLLDHAPGENKYNLVLAGGHGAPPEPYAEARPRMAVKGEVLAQAIQKRLLSRNSVKVEKYLYPFLYLDASYLDTSGVRDLEPARVAAGRAALEQAPVAGYYTSGGSCSTHNEWERRFRNSFHLKRSGDLMLSYRPEYIEDFDAGRGVSYGSLYNYDVRVPLCFFGPQFRAGVFESPVESVDVAPTLARALGVETPSSSTGRVLGEAFA
ncbi:MAG TPA: alkaline phosphatase family protein [Bryobacteraceae bacterium]|jgi:hypothetical protein